MTLRGDVRAPTRNLARLDPRPGMRCLEVGAGGGSIARWLTARVAPGGSVLATDLKAQHIAPAPGPTIEVHDITSGPLPEGALSTTRGKRRGPGRPVPELAYNGPYASPTPEQKTGSPADLNAELLLVTPHAD
ncbi:class I SAM-dependent methyltransferase [Streptomyces noursei]|uniref:Uncharacterized protein n=1 Tax=Streptomyces noursei TaxID=1971 RepID=A0A2N8P7N2_STRNR|nr:hypothetical protein [Streptomyces noursei]PNE37031.1 hypothetical protein AOB60_21675 [Streptomyces noursei]